MTKPYRPNTQDPRIQKRVKSALDWTTTYVKPNKDNWISTREIQRHYGSLARPLGQWLKTNLLICVNDYYNNLQGICKTYKLNVDGYNNICLMFGYQGGLCISPKITEQLASGEFE